MGSRARVRARARATARGGLVHAHMFSPNMAFITPTPMNMPSISRLEKTIVVMEQVFQFRSLHMAARTFELEILQVRGSSCNSLLPAD